ncbi:MAG: hypothetical protein Phog2KO_22410 [Phototrophicaceae bacterium]
MTPTEVAILRTILYADVFSFPLTLDDLHRYLIHDIPLSKNKIDETLQKSTQLKQYLHKQDDYICLKTRQAIIDIRKEREKISQELWASANKYGIWLSHIPFVRMVALTGALAVRNPSGIDDDFDYLLVTSSGRVWLARAFAVLVVRIVQLFGRELCPNYVLADNQLVQSRQDLYTAHEVAQMIPIYGHETYHAIIEQNPWVQEYLPNVNTYTIQENQSYKLRKIAEWMLGGWLGDKIEAWEYKRKLSKFSPKIKQAQSSAEINQNSVKGHFEDHGQPVMQRYHELLHEYGLLDDSLQTLAGD